MDLLSVFLVFWRHKVAVLIVLLFTALATFSYFELKPRLYQTTAALLLVPPSPDSRLSPVEVANRDNPYTRSYDPGVIVNVVSTEMNSTKSRLALRDRGADPRYDVHQSERYGFSNPVAEILAYGPTAEAAQETAQLVVSSFQTQLEAIQKAENVDDRNLVRSRLVNPPEAGTRITSEALRPMIGIAAMGILMAFAVVVAAEAVAKARSIGAISETAPRTPGRESRSRSGRTRLARARRGGSRPGPARTRANLSLAGRSAPFDDVPATPLGGLGPPARSRPPVSPVIEEWERARRSRRARAVEAGSAAGTPEPARLVSADGSTGAARVDAPALRSDPPPVRYARPHPFTRRPPSAAPSQNGT